MISPIYTINWQIYWAYSYIWAYTNFRESNILELRVTVSLLFFGFSVDILGLEVLNVFKYLKTLKQLSVLHGKMGSEKKW